MYDNKKVILFVRQHNPIIMIIFIFIVVLSQVTSQRMVQHWNQTGSELDRLVAEVRSIFQLILGELNRRGTFHKDFTVALFPESKCLCYRSRKESV